MKGVDWAYLRSGCKTCGRTVEFFEGNKLSPKVKQDAKKETIGAAKALAVLEGCTELHATKGRQVVDVKLGKDRPDDGMIKGLLVGPTGNLRAPTIRVGKHLLVGFDQSMYERYLK
jgi:arsenate reductase-like glutaredoxin family protein